MSKDTSNKAPDPYYILRGHKYHINSVLFDKINSNLLYSGSGDGEIKLWNIEEKKCITTEIAHSDGIGGGILSLQWLSNNEFSQGDGGNILSQGRDGVIKIWNIVDNSTFKNTYRLDTNSLSLGKCSSIYNLLSISGSGIDPTSSPSQVEIWDLKNKKVINKLKPNNQQLFEKLGLPMSLKLYYHNNDDNNNNNNNIDSSNQSNDQIRLCTGYENGELLIWDLRNTSIPLVSTKLHNEPILSFALSNNSTKGISGSGDTNIIEFNINYETKQFNITKTHKLNNGGISEIKIRNDEKIYATAGWDKRIRIFNFKKQIPLAILKYHTESVYSIDFNSNNILASGSKDCRIALWDIYKK
ncbi:hypothetical protein RB653_008675 [Dictyostelium firmibasis]|uniref:Guanine nucleotide-binding protein subunit beta-like protein 1 n=1 Tax=Dictyostelium firmibasis TaxID=79012 RepID=A0AAN7TT49_9MYCE